MNKDSESDTDQKPDAAHTSSRLFLLRVWRTGDGRQDLQGKLQHTVTGQVHYFSGTTELVVVLRRLVFHPAPGDGD